MTRPRNDGFALVGALFMVLIVSVIGSSLIFVSRAETLSSLNYKTMSQGRYGAESGIHRAANHLMFTYDADAVNLADFDLTVTPVEYDGDPVVLSSDPDVDSNYPDDDVVTAFAAATTGLLDAQDADITFAARATLVSMRQIASAYTGTPVTLQTWEITGLGSIAGAASSAIEVSTIMERETRPAFTYAAFATYDGCDALVFSGGSETSSYDSTTALGAGALPAEDPHSADVGTNGNLNTNGEPTVINGSLSTPRTGLGNCSDNAITAADLGEDTDVSAMIQLPQRVDFPTPDLPDPLPPTTAVSFSTGNGNGGGGNGGGGNGNGNNSTPATCPTDVVNALDAAAAAYIARYGSLQAGDVVECTAVTDSVTGITRFTVDPPKGDPEYATVTLGNVTVNSANTELHLKEGSFAVNSLTVNGSASLIVDDGPVVINVAGKTSGGGDLTNVVDLEGSAEVSTPNFDPKMLQFVYAGESHLRVRGGANVAMLVYAPNADVELAGQADFYGAMVGRLVRVTGGAEIHYDRNLRRSPARSAAEYTLSAFTWKTF